MVVPGNGPFVSSPRPEMALVDVLEKEPYPNESTNKRLFEAFWENGQVFILATSDV